MDIKLSLDYLDNLENTNIKVDVIKFQKMLFFYINLGILRYMYNNKQGGMSYRLGLAFCNFGRLGLSLAGPLRLFYFVYYYFVFRTSQ